MAFRALRSAVFTGSSRWRRRRRNGGAWLAETADAFKAIRAIDASGAAAVAFAVSDARTVGGKATRAFVFRTSKASNTAFEAG